MDESTKKTLFERFMHDVDEYGLKSGIIVQKPTVTSHLYQHQYDVLRDINLAARRESNPFEISEVVHPTALQAFGMQTPAIREVYTRNNGAEYIGNEIDVDTENQEALLPPTTDIDSDTLSSANGSCFEDNLTEPYPATKNCVIQVDNINVNATQSHRNTFSLRGNTSKTQIGALTGDDGINLNQNETLVNATLEMRTNTSSGNNNTSINNRNTTETPNNTAFLNNNTNSNTEDHMYAINISHTLPEGKDFMSIKYYFLGDGRSNSPGYQSTKNHLENILSSMNYLPQNQTDLESNSGYFRAINITGPSVNSNISKNNTNLRNDTLNANTTVNKERIKELFIKDNIVPESAEDKNLTDVTPPRNISSLFRLDHPKTFLDILYLNEALSKIIKIEKNNHHTFRPESVDLMRSMLTSMNTFYSEHRPSNGTIEPSNPEDKSTEKSLRKEIQVMINETNKDINETYAHNKSDSQMSQSGVAIHNEVMPGNNWSDISTLNNNGLKLNKDTVLRETDSIGNGGHINTSHYKLNDLERYNIEVLENMSIALKEHPVGMAIRNSLERRHSDKGSTLNPIQNKNALDNNNDQNDNHVHNGDGGVIGEDTIDQKLFSKDVEHGMTSKINNFVSTMAKSMAKLYSNVRALLPDDDNILPENISRKISDDQALSQNDDLHDLTNKSVPVTNAMETRMVTDKAYGVDMTSRNMTDNNNMDVNPGDINYYDARNEKSEIKHSPNSKRNMQRNVTYNGLSAYILIPVNPSD